MVDIHLHYTDEQDRPSFGLHGFALPPVPGTQKKSKYRVTLKPYDTWRKRTRWAWSIADPDRDWSYEPLTSGTAKTREKAREAATATVAKFEARDRRRQELADAVEVL